jgi:hypothetical protein
MFCAGLAALITRGVHHQPVQRFGYLDLTGQARRRLHVEGGVEHFFLFLGRRADNLSPGIVHMDKARGTSAGATAFGDNASHPIPQCSFHDRRAHCGVDGADCAVMLNESDLRHRNRCFNAALSALAPGRGMCWIRRIISLHDNYWTLHASLFKGDGLRRRQRKSLARNMRRYGGAYRRRERMLKRRVPLRWEPFDPGATIKCLGRRINKEGRRFPSLGKRSHGF